MSQCSAPDATDPTIRCPAFCTGRSDHCPAHQRRCVPAYLSYKKKAAAAEAAYVITPLADPAAEVLRLQQVFTLLYAAFNGRRGYNNIAYYDEFADAAHNHQFVRLYHQIRYVSYRLIWLLENTSAAAGTVDEWNYKLDQMHRAVRTTKSYLARIAAAGHQIA